MHDCVQNVTLLMDKHSLENSNGDTSLKAIKDDVTFINSLHLKFRSIICLNMSRPLKQVSKLFICSQALSRIFVRKIFCKLLSKHLAEFTLIKVPFFQHILLDTIRRTNLKYENYFLRGVLFQAFKQYLGTSLKLQKTHGKNIGQKYIKSESPKSYLKVH